MLNNIENERIEALEDMLERTTNYMNSIQVELEAANSELELRNNELSEGLRYSAHLQNTVMPSEERLKAIFKDSFLINMPKDQIGGDTLWVRETEEHTYLACIDCTGHGIPGAMLTMAAQFTLNSLFESRKFESPSQMLYEFIIAFKSHINLNKEDEDIKDSMDMSISIIDKKTKKLRYSGINHSLIVMKNQELFTYKGGVYFFGELDREILKTTEIDIEGDETLILGSDGYKDQFGGAKDKKFGQARLDKLIQSTSKLKLDKQKEILVSAIEDWRGSEDQTDDILLVGFKI